MDENELLKTEEGTAPSPDENAAPATADNSIQAETAPRKPKRRKAATVFFFIFGGLAAAVSLLRLVYTVSELPLELDGLEGVLFILFDMLLFSIPGAALLLIALIFNLFIKRLGLAWTVTAGIAVLFTVLYFLLFQQGLEADSPSAAAVIAASVALPNLATVIAAFDISLRRWRAKK